MQHENYINYLKTQLDDANELITKLQAERREDKAKIEELKFSGHGGSFIKRALESRDAEIGKLKGKLDEKRKQCLILERDMCELRAKTADLQMDNRNSDLVSALRMRIADKEQKIKSLESQVQETRLMNQEMWRELVKLRKALHERDDAIELPSGRGV